MRDTQKIVRKAVFGLLDGAITYNSATVGVFDEKQPVDNSDNVYILLSTQQEAFNETGDTFITQSSIDIEIIAKTDTEVTKDIIDDISDDIYTLLRPTPDTTGLTPDSGFLIQNVYRESAITQTFAITETQSITRKIIRVTVTVIEQ